MVGEGCSPHGDGEEVFAGEEEVPATRIVAAASSGGAPTAEGRARLSGKGHCRCDASAKGGESSGWILSRDRERGEEEVEGDGGRRPCHRWSAGITGGGDKKRQGN
jgi:hypothetical protein